MLCIDTMVSSARRSIHHRRKEPALIVSNDILGRYYTLLSKKNSIPEKLGRQIVKKIPKQPKPYAGEFNTSSSPKLIAKR